MTIRKDLSGQKFGRLIVYEEWYSPDTKRWMAFCICECGNTTDVVKNSLKSGNTKSCGCLQREKIKGISVKHGESSNGKRSKEYRTLRGMIRRCYDLNHVMFPYYGGRGIKVCQRWLDSFKNFLEDMGRAPSSKHSIDRIDNNGDYCPENCRWATREEQDKNRSNNRYFECNNKKQNLTQWTKELKVSFTFIYKRLKKGMSFEEIVKEARLKNSSLSLEGE